MLCFFFFNDTATTEIYTLSLHDALPISARQARGVELVDDPVGVGVRRVVVPVRREVLDLDVQPDRKSTRLNSSHANISYAVFCLKKKKILNHLNNQIYIAKREQLQKAML